METTQIDDLVRLLLPQGIHPLATHALCFLANHPNPDNNPETSKKKMQAIARLVGDMLHRGFAEVKPNLLGRIIGAAYFDERQGLAYLLDGLREVQKKSERMSMMTDRDWAVGCLLGSLAILSAIAQAREPLPNDEEAVADFMVQVFDACGSSEFQPKDDEFLAPALKEFLMSARHNAHGLRVLLGKLADASAAGDEKNRLVCKFADDLMHKMLTVCLERVEALGMFDEKLSETTPLLL